MRLGMRLVDPVTATLPLAAVILIVAVSARIGATDALLGLLLLVPLVAVTMKRPQKGLLILVALAPFDGLRIVIPQMNAGLKFALLVLVFISTFVCPRDARRSAAPWHPGIVVPLMCLVAVGVVSAARVGPTAGFVGLKIDFAYVLAAVAAWRCPMSSAERDRLVTILMTTGFICSLYGIFQQVIGPTRLHDQFGYPYNDVIRFASGDFFRSFSTFDQSAPFGLFLMLVLLVGLPVALSNRSRLRNVLFLYATPVFGIALLLAFARTALVGLAVGLLYLGVRRYRIVLAGMAFVVALMLIFAAPLAKPISSSTSLNQRAQGWSENISQVRANPFGAGIGSTGSAAETVSKLEGKGSDGRYQPDNYYFKTVYELGLVGLWFLVLLYIGAVRLAASVADRSTLEVGFFDGITATFIAAMAASVFSSYLEIFPMDLYFWTFLGIVASVAAQQHEAEPAIEAPPRLAFR